MRDLMMITAAVVALAGCSRETSDNQMAEAPAAAIPAAAERLIKASFDCGRARGQAQELVCGDVTLAAMDREVARLAALAAEPAGLANYASQRDNCWKADELRQCVMATAMIEMHRLRQGSEVARRDGGLSFGPVAYNCRGIAGRVLATLFKGDLGAAALEWGGQVIAIDRAQGADGERYEGRWNGQPYAFRTSAREATFTLAGKGDLQCTEAPAD